MSAPGDPPSAPSTASAPTREALLLAAGDVFAEVGYQAATVRQICRRAGANIAAVNYHFGDKGSLYLAVLRHALGAANARHPFDGGVASDAPPDRRLLGFVRNFLARLFDQREHAWLGRLMAREMIEPSHALDFMVAERIRPMAQQLGGIVRELLGPRADDETIWRCGFSIVSQCLFYNHCRSVVTRLRPADELNLAMVDRLAEHITAFSLAALRPLARRAGGGRRIHDRERRPPTRAARRGAPSS
jgi:AcrR family transcriptional regulator